MGAPQHEQMGAGGVGLSAPQAGLVGAEFPLPCFGWSEQLEFVDAPEFPLCFSRLGDFDKSGGGWFGEEEFRVADFALALQHRGVPRLTVSGQGDGVAAWIIIP